MNLILSTQFQSSLSSLDIRDGKFQNKMKKQ